MLVSATRKGSGGAAHSCQTLEWVVDADETGKARRNADNNSTESNKTFFLVMVFDKRDVGKWPQRAHDRADRPVVINDHETTQKPADI